ncbi:MAG: hypothetical protein KU37_03185 [Sulfuricurvum sp. PC08-66]|nr:MAG: hypothetical protein KU37_03185 [Sulfuricurvum sp. PC08-66]
MNIAVSGCLLGQKVRYDGGHKRDDFVADTLSKYADFVPFCPEAIAFGTPRESIRLVGSAEDVRVIGNKSDRDVTLELFDASMQSLFAIDTANLGGIIFKSKSPSCGMGSAKLYLDNGMTQGKADGLFAHACRAKWPHLPMEEEGRLQDRWLRENFVMHLFAYDAWEKFRASVPSIGKLVYFHTRNKFLLQAKDEARYRALGKLVGNHENIPLHTLLEQYEALYREAIAQKSTLGRTRNVLEHMAGFFKNNLDVVEKANLHDAIEQYSAKEVPLIVPVGLLKLYAKKYAQSYIASQSFLDPYPKALALRSHLDSSR